jgi:Zn-dependent metalloprotease
MQKFVATAGAVLLLGTVGVALAQPASAMPAPHHTTPSTAVTRASALLATHRGLAPGGAEDSYQVTRVIVDGDGSSHVRYARSYRNLPIIGGDFIVHETPTGAFAGLSQSPVSAFALSTTPHLSVDRAREASLKAFAGTVEKTVAPRLVIDAISTPTLAWETVVSGKNRPGDPQTPSVLHVLINAANGSVMESWDDVMTATGHSLYSGTVAINTTHVPGIQKTELKDNDHGNGYVCDMKNAEWGTCSQMMSSTDEWGDGTVKSRESAAVDAEYGAATTFDYFKTVHGQSGVLGDGRGVPSRVHVGNGWVNAMWNGADMTMSYGDGMLNVKPLVSLDVAGHEMTHGVTQYLAGLRYARTESGGINESTSDIFGTMVKFYANNSRDPGGYEIGSRLNIRGDGKPLRYMYQPSLDGSSFDCWKSSVGNADPHYSSGVGNHLFFLLSEGSGKTAYGTSPTCNNQAITGIGREKAAKIWYHALDAYMVLDETYAMARQSTLNAASDLYGRCGAEYKSVQAAWTAVNVVQPFGTEPTCP